MLNVTCKKSDVGYASNTYVISSNDETAVIDPSYPYNESLIVGKLKYIILTHSHFDHMLEIDSWQKATGAPVLVSEYEEKAPADANYNCYKLFLGVENGYYGPVTTIHDGDELILGAETLKVIECPGHTQGSIALYSAPFAFVGDTIFEGGGFGRFDLPGGDFFKLRESLKKLTKLPEGTTVLPGHGNDFTLRKY